MDKEIKDERFTKAYSRILARYLSGQDLNVDQLETMAKKGGIEILVRYVPEIENLYKKISSFKFVDLHFVVLKMEKNSVTADSLGIFALEHDFFSEEDFESIDGDALKRKLKTLKWFQSCVRKNPKERNKVFIASERIVRKKEEKAIPYFWYYKIPPPHKGEKERLDTYGSRWSPSIPPVLYTDDVLLVKRRAVSSEIQG